MNISFILSVILLTLPAATIPLDLFTTRMDFSAFNKHEIYALRKLTCRADKRREKAERKERRKEAKALWETKKRASNPIFQPREHSK